MHSSLRVGLFFGVIAFAAFCTSAQSQPANPFNEKNPRVQLVTEFVRDLEVLYRLQETAKKNLLKTVRQQGRSAFQG